ncbi:MAG: hypothetical protein ACQKBY_10210 [Verrucomicrobiales bacterium]
MNHTRPKATAALLATLLALAIIILSRNNSSNEEPPFKESISQNTEAITKPKSEKRILEEKKENKTNIDLQEKAYSTWEEMVADYPSLANGDAEILRLYQELLESTDDWSQRSIIALILRKKLTSFDSKLKAAQMHQRKSDRLAQISMAISDASIDERQKVLDFLNLMENQKDKSMLGSQYILNTWQGNPRQALKTMDQLELPADARRLITSSILISLKEKAFKEGNYDQSEVDAVLQHIDNNRKEAVINEMNYALIFREFDYGDPDSLESISKKYNTDYLKTLTNAVSNQHYTKAVENGVVSVESLTHWLKHDLTPEMKGGGRYRYGFGVLRLWSDSIHLTLAAS